MRLFVAFDFDGSLEKIQDQIDRSAARFFFPKTFHLTLKFIGEAQDVDEIRQKLSSVQFSPFEVELSEIGTFPSSQKINVIWVGVKDKNGEISSLQKMVDASLSSIFPPEQKFHPHVTLARVKFIKDRAKLKENLKNIKAEKQKFTINEFVLYKSTLTPEGSVYEMVERYPARY